MFGIEGHRGDRGELLDGSFEGSPTGGRGDDARWSADYDCTGFGYAVRRPAEMGHWPKGPQGEGTFVSYRLPGYPSRGWPGAHPEAPPAGLSEGSLDEQHAPRRTGSEQGRRVGRASCRSGESEAQRSTGEGRRRRVVFRDPSFERQEEEEEEPQWEEKGGPAQAGPSQGARGGARRHRRRPRSEGSEILSEEGSQAGPSQGKRLRGRDEWVLLGHVSSTMSGEQDALWQRKPGANNRQEDARGARCCRPLEEASDALVTQEGGVFDTQGGVLPPLFSRYYRQQLSGRMSPAMRREAQTLAFMLDLGLRGRVVECLDMAAQRLKSLEMMMGGAHYTVAQQSELLPKEETTMSSMTEFSEAAKRAREDGKARLEASRPYGSRGTTWTRPDEWGKASGKKGQAKGKGATDEATVDVPLDGGGGKLQSGDREDPVGVPVTGPLDVLSGPPGQWVHDGISGWESGSGPHHDWQRRLLEPLPPGLSSAEAASERVDGAIQGPGMPAVGAANGVAEPAPKWAGNDLLCTVDDSEAWGLLWA